MKFTFIINLSMDVEAEDKEKASERVHQLLAVGASKTEDIDLQYEVVEVWD